MPTVSESIRATSRARETCQQAQGIQAVHLLEMQSAVSLE